MLPLLLRKVTIMGETIFNYLYQFFDSFSFLILAAMGLAVVFGMMNIINMAHGEFIMLGAYVFTIACNHGVPFILSVVLAVIFVAAFGVMMDRLIICRLYSRPLDSIVVTWGISLAVTQIVQIIFGTSLPSVSVPLGSFTIGESRFSVYRIVLVGIAALLLAGFYFLFMHTKFGLYSRATMQNAEVAKSLGINTNFEYSATFAVGAGVAGLTGALYAPLMAVSPSMGQSFSIQAFTTVVVGGANPLVGTVLSGASLGIVNSVVSLEAGQFMGRIAMLAAAIVCIRVFPLGFSGLVEKIRKGGR